MCADRAQCSLPGEVLMELVLESDERVISGLVESDISQHSSCKVGPYPRGLDGQSGSSVSGYLTSLSTVMVSSFPSAGATSL